MKKLANKLSLNKQTLVSLDSSEMMKLKGGITSIGAQCSCNNSCSRVDKFCCCAATQTKCAPEIQ